MRKVLLTGGSGFIGRNILEQLSAEYQIFAPSSQELNLLNAEEVEKYFSLHNFDIVIYAANYGGNRSQAGLAGVFETNKKMFLNLTKNSSAFGRMIFFGSGAEYGKQRDIVKIKEEDFGKIRPEDEYGKAKYFASEYISQSTNIANFRLFGVFGKYEDFKTRFISNAICHAIFNLPIVINKNVVFDYLYVDDLIKIISHFLQNSPKEKFYNVGTGQRVDLLSLADIVKKTSGKDLKIIVKTQGLNREYTCDNNRLMSELVEFEFTPLGSSIAELYKWYDQNKSMLNKEQLDF